MWRKTGILSIVLVLTLAVSSVALAGHMFSHKAASTANCSLCVHAASGSNGIAPEPVVFNFIPIEKLPDCTAPTTVVQKLSLHDHPSRAPPSSI